MSIEMTIQEEDEEVWEEKFAGKVLELKNKLMRNAIDEGNYLSSTFNEVNYRPRDYGISSIDDLYDHFKEHLEGMTKEDWEEVLKEQSNLKK